METIEAARTAVRIWYNDKDISANIAPMLQSFEYTDYGSGQVDDLQIAIKDPDDRWLNAWYPDEGARLRAEIVITEGSVTEVLPCGEFVIDAPGYSHPGIMSLKGTSASVTTALRRQKKARFWLHATLKSVAARIAEEHGVSIVFVGPDTPALTKTEQKDESDLGYLLRQCEREGYALKVESNRLVIYRQADIDAQPPALTIDRRGGRVISYDFNENLTDSYRSCKVRYRHPDIGILYAEYTPPNPPENGQVLIAREHCGTQAEALRLAKAKLELANRKRKAGDLELHGDVRLVSGVVIEVKGWGHYDGRYTVDEAKHVVGSGYRTSIKIAAVMS